MTGTAKVSARAVVVDFLDAWRFCPVSEAENPSRACLEDAADQLLAALAPVVDSELREVAQRLLDLKDGPRDDAYREAKPKAWADLRAVLENRLRNLDSPGAQT